MKRYIVISDLHLACHEVDNFTNKDNYILKIQAFIDFLEKNFKDEDLEKLILLGDIFELWQGEVDNDNVINNIFNFSKIVKQRIEKIIKRYKDIYNVLTKNKHKIVYILGNHDNYLPKEYKKELNVLETDRLILNINNQNFHFLHGHQFDSIYKTKIGTFFGRAVTELYGLMEKKLNLKIDFLKNIKNIFETSSKKSDEEFIKKCEEYIQKNNCFLITGHTHKPKILIEKKYINSGCGVEEIIFGYHSANEIDYVEIISSENNNEIKLKKICIG